MLFIENLIAVTDFNCIRKNIFRYRKLLPERVKITLMLKADAYGHGLIETAKNTLDLVDCFGVMNADEGLNLRLNGIFNPVTVTVSEKEEFKNLVKFNLEPCLKSSEELLFLDYHAEAQSKIISYYIKTDTGMNRLGIKNISDFEEMTALSLKLKNIRFKGIVSHISSESNKNAQIKRFEEFISVADCYYKDYIKQISSSSYATDFPYDMVRLGIGAYGYGKKSPLNLLPALSVYSKVNSVKNVRKGEKIGYSDAFVAKKDMCVAVIRGGYNDGIRRDSTGGKVIINGSYAEIIGNVCMDLFFADVTDLNVKEGDTVTVLGSQNGLDITADDIAEHCNTIPYEILTSFKGRLKRYYLL